VEIPRPENASSQKHFWKAGLRIATFVMLGLAVYLTRGPSVKEQFRVQTEVLRREIFMLTLGFDHRRRPEPTRQELEEILRKISVPGILKIQESNGQFHIDGQDFVIHLEFKDYPEDGVTVLEASLRDPPLSAFIFSIALSPPATHELEFVDLVDTPPARSQDLPQSQR
jgi:hypothetical protein